MNKYFCLNLLLHYLHRGKHFLIDIATFVVAVIIGQIASYQLFKYSRLPKSADMPAMIAMTVLAIIFIIFTLSHRTSVFSKIQILVITASSLARILECPLRAVLFQGKQQTRYKSLTTNSMRVLGGDHLRPKKLPRMNETELTELIEEQILCRIAFKGKNAPYIAPFQYALVDGKLYFHFTKYGKKIGFLEECKRVCVEIETYTQDLSQYKFAVLTGELRIVTDPQERARAIKQLVDTAKVKHLSENFLVAHGFPKDKGWSFLTSDKPLVIVKLDNVIEKIGLKSP